MIKPMIVLLLAFSVFLCISEACRCVESSDEQRSLRAYCLSDWIAEFTVTEVKAKGEYYEYSINYTAVHKMSLRFKDNYPTEIYSKQSPYDCGMYKLPIGWEYFAVGYHFVEYDRSLQKSVFKIELNTCSYMDWDMQQKVKNNSTIDCSKLDMSFYGARPAYPVYNYGRNW